MSKITHSVGRAGVNRPQDVAQVREMLNRQIGALTPYAPLAPTGACDCPVMALIEEFQRRVMGVPAPDGRIDPNGRTLRALESMGAAAKPGSAPAPPNVSGLALPPAALKVLKEVLAAAGIQSARVTSVSRTPAEQARVMYENCASRGAAFNKKMYAAAGDKVVAVYEANTGKARHEVIALMLAKIREVGPDKVSKHISDSHYTFDVDPSSIPPAKHKAFLQALGSHPAVSNVIPPPVDPAFHIEIPKSAPTLTSGAVQLY
jgi:hypothetical protein